MSTPDLPPNDEEQRQAEILSRHLDPSYTAHLEGAIPDTPPQSSANSQSHNGPEQDQEAESSLKLQGGDIHRDLYKIGARASPIQRAHTFSHTTRPEAAVNVAAEQRQPGGFRRQFVLQNRGWLDNVTAPVTSNFVHFLDLYGSFAGEDLEESEEEFAVGEEEEGGLRQRRGVPREAGEGERQPLLGRPRQRRPSTASVGDASVMRTFFLLLKSFVGTGVLFLPKAFKNGGLLFSSICLVTVSIVSYIGFLLLLQCRARHGGGYGDVGEAIAGPRMRSIILSSITISQFGFVCAGIIFTAENMGSFLEAVTHTSSPLSTPAIIGIQVLLLIPLAFIRKISNLGSAALLADVCILLGLGYIYYFEISTLSTHGMHKTVKLFNPQDFTLTIGSAIFTFEGIGLILPVQSSMKQQHKFDRILALVMLIITILFTSIGFLSYATFGSATSVEIISNLPQDNKLVNAVQFLYSLAVLVGTPMQLFPAMRIVESALFGHRSGRRDHLTKWKKNAFRTAVVAGCGVLAAAGSADLDKFVALIGAFACVPLVYIYPAFLHWKGVAESRWAKAGDVLFMSVGLVAMVYTTTVTVVRWSE
jgi:proton-coupled amino acid transporter